MNLKIALYLIAVTFIAASCSTTVNVSNEAARGKTVLITPLNLSLSKKKNKNVSDSICTCTYESIAYTLAPHLQTAGMKSIQLPYEVSKKNAYQLKQLADSLHADYILVGAGVVDQVGSSTFIDQLSINVINVKTGDVFIGASFAGSGTGAVKAANRIGKKLMKKLNG